MYLYSVILLLSISGPILFSFEKRVFYFSYWKKVVISALLSSIPFLLWDVLFTQKGVWGFNSKYILGVKIFSLPLEEIIFFVAIPFSVMIFWQTIVDFEIYEKVKKEIIFYIATTILSIILFLDFPDKIYTLFASTAVLLTNLFLFFQKEYIKKSFIVLFFVSIPLFFLVNGILTGIPIVTYDAGHKSNIMFSTIPLEDLFFSYSLLSLNVIVFEKVKKITIL